MTLSLGISITRWLRFRLVWFDPKNWVSRKTPFQVNRHMP